MLGISKPKSIENFLLQWCSLKLGREKKNPHVANKVLKAAVDAQKTLPEAADLWWAIKSRSRWCKKLQAFCWPNNLLGQWFRSFEILQTNFFPFFCFFGKLSFFCQLTTLFSNVNFKNTYLCYIIKFYVLRYFVIWFHPIAWSYNTVQNKPSGV